MESIETLNTRLEEFFGKDSDSNQPIFRIVWANDQTEMRKVEYSEAGIQFITPRVMECKKYPYLKDLYVLERLVLIPETSAEELPSMRKSYEPIWSYCDADRNPVPPAWPPTKFVVDTLYAALGKQSMAKYVDPEIADPETRAKGIEKLHEELFGNDSEVSDALHYREGVVVPSNFKKEEIN